MPITFAKKGERVSIKEIKGRDDTKRFLGSLGFIIGEEVVVVSEFRGNLIVNVKDTRVAIDSKMANRILI
ncbi:FeoA family protein [Tissierellaceae bacterium HCP3S3_D8]